MLNNDVSYSPGSGKLEPSPGSFDSSPRSGPSRSASLRVKTTEHGPRVTFSDTQTMSRFLENQWFMMVHLNYFFVLQAKIFTKRQL